MNRLAEPYQRYLRLLGFAQPPSGLDGLKLIVRRHLCRVPFENVSKLLLIGREKAGRVTTLSEFLDGIEYRDLGGTCYTSNPFLWELLRALNYEADLLAADMSKPDEHTSIRVRLNGFSYHIDVGYAAPFREPMRLDQLPCTILHGKYRYVFDRASGPDRYDLSVFCGNDRVHGYVVHDPPRPFEFFRETILQSYTPGRDFLSCLRITRFFDDHAVELKNTTLTCYRGAESKQVTLHTWAELEDAAVHQLAMPRCPLRNAVGVLQQLLETPLFAIDGYPARY